MARIDRDLGGKSTQRVSQTDINRASERDDVGRTKPTDVQSDFDWNNREAPSGTLVAKLGDFVAKKKSS